MEVFGGDSTGVFRKESMELLVEESKDEIGGGSTELLGGESIELLEGEAVEVVGESIELLGRESSRESAGLRLAGVPVACLVSGAFPFVTALLSPISPK